MNRFCHRYVGFLASGNEIFLIKQRILILYILFQLNKSENLEISHSFDASIQKENLRLTCRVLMVFTSAVK